VVKSASMALPRFFPLESYSHGLGQPRQIMVSLNAGVVKPLALLRLEHLHDGSWVGMSLIDEKRLGLGKGVGSTLVGKQCQMRVHRLSGDPLPRDLASERWCPLGRGNLALLSQVTTQMAWEARAANYLGSSQAWRGSCRLRPWP
jgi:hypothetical protein